MSKNKPAFNPDSEVNADFLDFLASESPEQKGHRALLVAVLDRGIRDALGKRVGNEVLPERIGVSRNNTNEARRWIRSDSEEPWSFLWVLINLDLVHLTRRIRRRIYESQNF